MEATLTKTDKKAFILYHDNCMDGFGSAWAFHMLAEHLYREVEYIPVSYGKLIPEQLVNVSQAGAYDVFILDFSYPCIDLKGLANHCMGNIHVIDHHKTAKEELSKFPVDVYENVHIYFDMNRRGAMLTWNIIGQLTYNNTPAPDLIKYIQDRDLWRFELHMSKEINALIAATNKNFREYIDLNSFIEVDFTNAMLMGSALMDQHNKIVDDIVKLARPVTIYSMGGEKYSGLACNCTAHFASDVGNKLAQKSETYGATYYTDADGTVCFSLRSIGEYDVSKLAKLFGGGGHKNASGFKLALEEDSDNSISLFAGENFLPTIQTFCTNPTFNQGDKNSEEKE